MYWSLYVYTPGHGIPAAFNLVAVAVFSRLPFFSQDLYASCTGPDDNTL